MNIIKRFIISILILGIYHQISYSIYNSSDDEIKNKTISSILIEGERNVKEKTIKSQIKSKVGKPYSQEQLISDMQNILKLNYFENVEVAIDTGTMKVVFKIKEKPFIKTINIKGNKKISTGKIKEEIPLKEKEFFDQSLLEESKIKILSLYAEKGYSDCKVEVYLTTNELNNHITLSFFITEGNRILVGDVKIEGVKSFKPKKILRIMKTKRKKVFKEDVLYSDITEIEKFFKNNGFIQVNISTPEITYNNERTLVNILINIQEGVKFKIGKINFLGNYVYKDDELLKSLVIKSGKIYNEDELQESKQAILEMYANKGYINAQLDTNFKPDINNGLIDIDMEITENNIIYLGKIYIEGLSGNTKEYVISREIILKEGDVFAAPKVRRSIERIYNLGFIDAVEPSIQPTEIPDVMDLILNITEGKPGILTAGAGYSSIDQLIGTLQVQHINLLGRAQRLNLTWEFGARKQNYELNWTEPWFLNKPMSLGFSIFKTERTRDYGTKFSAYKEGRKGGSIRLGPRLSDYLSLLFGYTYEEVKVFDIDSELINEIVETNDVTSSIQSQIIWDSRDNIFDASRGNRQSFSVQIAGGPLGGDIEFIKTITRSSWFFPSFWKFVFSINGMFGIIEKLDPFSSKDIPIYERFYVGGADTVRGYEYRSEIGPTEGGKSTLVFNVEYKFPLIQEKKRTILQGAFFVDLGGAWTDIKDVNLEIGNGDRNIKAGIGFGIRFTTPVFPLRLDWGYGLNHKPGEKLSQFYFTIGNLF